jgi:hypothetical protein
MLAASGRVIQEIGMSAHRLWFLRTLGLGILLVAAPTSAQQVTIGVPQQNISDNYFEYIGRRPPVFGGGSGAAGLSVGPWSAATGRSTVYTSETPYLTVTNGIPGSIFIGRATPFVTSVVPVFGNGAVPFNPAFNNLGAANSLEGRFQRGEFHIREGRVFAGPDPRLALPPDLVDWEGLQVKQPPPQVALEEEFRIATEANVTVTEHSASDAPAAAADSAARELFDKGRQLEAEGKVGAAKLLYQTALRSADDSLRSEIRARLEELAAKPTASRAVN